MSLAIRIRYDDLLVFSSYDYIGLAKKFALKSRIDSLSFRNRVSTAFLVFGKKVLAKHFKIRILRKAFKTYVPSACT